MKKLSILGVFVVLGLAGCGSVMCSLTGNAIGSCSALKQAASQSQTAGGGETPAAEPSSPSATSESQPAAPAAKDCLSSGTKTDNYHKCCNDAAKTQIEAAEGIFTCA
ncbi:MAG TPA: hypothetical protein VGO00_22475 [Kofleriaceae bacterium]|jgi:uncharacterized protein YceK|nr:hypothetical protein [Kofleriaceae bacterium]